MLAISSFLFFTGLVALLSWWFTRHDDQGTSTGYFLAGRSLSWFVVAGSLLLTNLSTEQLVGLNGQAFSNGMEVMAWELGAAVAMVVMALVCLPVYLRGGITTVPEFLESRYDRMTRSLISLMILVAVTVSVMPFVLYSGAIFMVDLFELPKHMRVDHKTALWLTVISIGVVGSIYAIFGGLRAVAVSDTLNGVGLFVAGLILPYLGLRAMGDGQLARGWYRLTHEHVDRLFPFGEPTSDVPWPTLFTGVALLHLYYWCTNQFIVQRTFAVRSLQQGQRGVLFAAFMKLLGPIYLILPGVIAYHLYLGEIGEKGNLAYSTLVRNLLPTPLRGFFAAAIFGAILSSFNSALNSCATLFSVDLYKGVLRREATEPEMVRVGKWFGAILALLVILAAPWMGSQGAGVFDAMKKIAAVFDIPLMSIVFVGILSKRTPAFAAWAAVFVGIVFYVLVTFVWKGQLLGFELHWLHVAGLNFVLMMAVMAICRGLRPLRVAYEHVNTHQVDLTPWAWSRPAALFIVVAVCAMYGYLAVIGR